MWPSSLLRATLPLQTVEICIICIYGVELQKKPAGTSWEGHYVRKCEDGQPISGRTQILLNSWGNEEITQLLAHFLRRCRGFYGRTFVYLVAMRLCSMWFEENEREALHQRIRSFWHDFRKCFCVPEVVFVIWFSPFLRLFSTLLIFRFSSHKSPLRLVSHSALEGGTELCQSCEGSRTANTLKFTTIAVFWR